MTGPQLFTSGLKSSWCVKGLEAVLIVPQITSAFYTKLKVHAFSQTLKKVSHHERRPEPLKGKQGPPTYMRQASLDLVFLPFCTPWLPTPHSLGLVGRA